MKLIIDCMGGDHAPHEMLAGVVSAYKDRAADCEFLLVGNESRIKAVAEERGYDLTPFEIRHTEAVITMDDDAMVWRSEKKDASMTVALRALADGEGDAVVSCTNTGALFAGATMIARRAKGVHRAAIGTVLPFDPPVLLLDSGANVSVSAEYMEQFAVMGTTYMKTVMGVENPRVGLLNNGAEEHKGTQVQIDAYQLLSANSELNFVGNVEGNRVMHDTCDVLVADGFSGNILLKTMEGMGKLMLKTMKKLFLANTRSKLAALAFRSRLGEVKKSFDASEYGGAPILGIARPVIKAHGSSDANAFKNAIRQAIVYSENEVTEEMSEALKRLSERKKAAKAAAENQEG